MIIGIITNFAIIFSSFLLLYWVISSIKNKNHKFTAIERNMLSIIIGLGFGVIALIITILFFNMSNNVLVNTRFITFLLSGLLGGPVAMLANAIFIFSIRFMLGVDTIQSLIVSINALSLGVILSIVAIYKPITLKSIHYYFTFILLEITILLLYINNLTFQVLGYISIFLCYSVALYAFIIFVIKHVNTIKYNAHKSIALTKVDFLTQIPNNLALENKLQDYIDQKISFEMAHLDVDLFKNFNMQYGYRQGDQLLSQLAQTLQMFADTHDSYVARIGGDEFCYVKRNTNPASTINEIYELCKLVENTDYTVDNQQVRVTLSASVISYPDNAETLREIYTASNYALRIITETSTNTIKHINQIKQEHPNY